MAVGRSVGVVGAVRACRVVTISQPITQPAAIYVNSMQNSMQTINVIIIALRNGARVTNIDSWSVARDGRCIFGAKASF